MTRQSVNESVKLSLALCLLAVVGEERVPENIYNCLQEFARIPADPFSLAFQLALSCGESPSTKKRSIPFSALVERLSKRPREDGNVQESSDYFSHKNGQKIRDSERLESIQSDLQEKSRHAVQFLRLLAKQGQLTSAGAEDEDPTETKFMLQDALQVCTEFFSYPLPSDKSVGESLKLMEEIVGRAINWFQSNQEQSLLAENIKGICEAAVIAYAQECQRILHNALSAEPNTQQFDNRKHILEFIESLAQMASYEFASTAMQVLLSAVEISLRSRDLNLFTNLLEPLHSVHKSSLLSVQSPPPPSNDQLNAVLDRILVEISPQLPDEEQFILHQIGRVIYPIGI